jgi:ABC-2 type transport system ATP-binding protein
MTTDVLVAAEGLAKRFGEVHALERIDLEVPAGAVLALLGPNGAGKTTTVRILTTLLTPDAGSARIGGFDVAREPGQVRRLIGLSGQYAAVDGFLTGRENLRTIGRLYGLDRRTAGRRADALLERVGLAAVASRAARTYSGGMRRRLDLAASLIGPPAVVFLDEPTTGLDPRGRIEIWQILTELTNIGTSVLLTTQDMDEAERLADNVIVIDRGRAIAEGSADALKRQVGGDRLELRTAPGEDPARLAAAVAPLATAAPTIDPVTGSVIVAVADGARILPELAAALLAADLRLADLALRRPTLEDVFLSLTGEPRSPAVESSS